MMRFELTKGVFSQCVMMECICGNLLLPAVVPQYNLFSGCFCSPRASSLDLVDRKLFK